MTADRTDVDRSPVTLHINANEPRIQADMAEARIENSHLTSGYTHF